jgi:acetyl-CoA synthetase
MSLVDDETPGTLFHPPPYLGPSAHVDGMQNYRRLYEESVRNPEDFWKGVAADFYWKTPATGPMLKSNFDVRNGPISTEFMSGATTNISYNALDRIVEKGLGEKIAYFW